MFNLSSFKSLPLALALVTSSASLAAALPSSNRLGDYTNSSRGNRHINWVVVDSDQKGLNCRLANTFQPRDRRDDVINRLLNVSYRADVPGWQSVARFRRGERLKVETGNMAQQIIVFDNRNKPWFPVMLNESEVRQGANPRYCLVRANRQFIQPVP